MEKYECGICGKTHQVFGRIESPQPRIILDIPENEREDRIVDLNGFYLIDKKLLIAHAYISIWLEGKEEPIFYWQAWASINLEEFKDNLQKITNGALVELDGELVSEIPLYLKSKGLKSKVLIQATDELSIELNVEEESQLKEDQSKPISKERVFELMNHIYHPEVAIETKSSEGSFDKRLSEELISVENNYITQNKGFVLSLIASSSTLFQIINNIMTESKNDDVLGFGLDLAFDHSFEEIKEVMQKLKEQTYAKDFQYHVLDDVPTYQIDLGGDKKAVLEMVKNIIKDVYDEDIESIRLDTFEV